MAENGRPAEESAPEPVPPGSVGTANSECPAEGAIFPLSKSSVDVGARPPHPDDLPKSFSSPSCSRTPSCPTDTAQPQLSPHGGPRVPETGNHQGGRMDVPYGPQAQQNQGQSYRPQAQQNQGQSYRPQAQQNLGQSYGPQAQQNLGQSYGPQAQQNLGELYMLQAQQNLGELYALQAQQNLGELYALQAQQNQCESYGAQAQQNQGQSYGPQAQQNQGEPYSSQAQQNQSGLFSSHSTMLETLPPRHRVERPHSIAETAPSHRTSSQTGAGAPSHLRAGEGVPGASRGSRSSLREEQTQPQVHRSLSAGLHTAREVPGPHPRRSQTSAPCPGGGYCGQGVPCCPMLVCKQPMQLLQSNTMTTCRSSGSCSPTQQLGGAGGMRICVPSPTHGEAGAEEPCFLGHGGLEDTFAAYCHPLPIPAPAQLLPRPPHPALLAFPRLISSVSETGLDAKRMMGCCGAGDCQDPLPPPPAEARATREAGTMTSRGELRDVGVQTGPPERPPAHVFPEVSLAVDDGTEGSNGAAGDQKSPIKEVLWDAEGMTWEVYGAAVDPEELGVAIQKHLELQIKEKASRVAQLGRQDTITSQQSRRRRKRGFTMGSLRNPACCARSSTVVD